MTINPAPANGVPVLTIADRLLISRRQSGLDTREFAERTGISKATINNYENPAYPRSRKPLYLKAWALGCGVDYHWIATGEVPAPPDDPSVMPVSGSACIRTPALATVTALGDRRVAA